MVTTTPEILAAKEYMLRKLGYSHPSGHTDKEKWYPDDSESAPCCNHVYQPSRSYPWTIYKHCFTLKHICINHNADISQVRFMIKNKPTLIGLDPKLDTWLEKELKGSQ